MGDELTSVLVNDVDDFGDRTVWRLTDYRAELILARDNLSESRADLHSVIHGMPS